MGFGTTFAMLSFLMIFAGMTIFVVNVQETMSVSANAIREQNTKTVAAQKQEITITGTSTEFATELEWVTTYDEEFLEGEFNSTIELLGDGITINGVGPDYYTSSIYDTGYSSDYTTLSWSSVVPLGGSLRFQIRTGNSIAELESATFLGPDGTSGTDYTAPGTTINGTAHNNSKYIQFQAEFFDSGGTPELYDVTIGIERPSLYVILNAENTGSEKLHPEETDIYIDGLRILRDESARILSLEQGTDPRLWNPGEELNLTIFTSTPATITVNNDRAQDQVSI
jgi:archaellum component FlaF (FlaF/FlaG flagellin family)